MSDLSNYSLKSPAELPIKLFYLLRAFSWSLILGAQLSFKDTLEETHPGRDSLRLHEKVGSHNKLNK